MRGPQAGLVSCNAVGRFDFPRPAIAQLIPTEKPCRRHCEQRRQGDGIHRPFAGSGLYSSSLSLLDDAHTAPLGMRLVSDPFRREFESLGESLWRRNRGQAEAAMAVRRAKFRMKGNAHATRPKEENGPPNGASNLPRQSHKIDKFENPTHGAGDGHSNGPDLGEWWMGVRSEPFALLQSDVVLTPLSYRYQDTFGPQCNNCCRQCPPRNTSLQFDAMTLRLRRQGVIGHWRAESGLGSTEQSGPRSRGHANAPVSRRPGYCVSPLEIGTQ